LWTGRNGSVLVARYILKSNKTVVYRIKWKELVKGNHGCQKKIDKPKLEEDSAKGEIQEQERLE